MARCKCNINRFLAFKFNIPSFERKWSKRKLLTLEKACA